MHDDTITQAYPGARVTGLIDRDDQLRDIKAAVQDRSGKTYVFRVTAGGGTGKTFLARRVLALCRPDGEWADEGLLAAQGEVDLFHHQSHSREGFMTAFVGALGNGQHFFAEFKKLRDEIDAVTYHMHGAIHELKARQEELERQFFEDYEQLAQQRRAVIVLDTVERLVYETLWVEDALGPGERLFGLRPWLLGEWLPRMRNAVILICGRPNERLDADLERAMADCPEIEFIPLILGDFGPKETEQYFEAVRETAAAEGNVEALRRLDTIQKEKQQVIYRLTDGHPITLALIIDYYLYAGRLLSEAKMPLREIKALPPDALKAIRERVQAEAVRQFRYIGRPADEVLATMVWARKGMDVPLLCHLLEMSPDEATLILDGLAHPRRGLSFVKWRPDERRVFLHDELYDVMKVEMEQFIPARRRQVANELVLYYKKQIDKLLEDMRALAAQEREEIAPGGSIQIVAAAGQAASPGALAQAAARLNNLRVEHAYYALQADPMQGYETYWEYADEAISANDVSLDMQLRDEMLTFVRDTFGDERAAVGGLRRKAVEVDEVIRWVWRFVYAGKSREAKDIASRLRTEFKAFVNEGGLLAHAYLDTAEAWADVHLGHEIEQAINRLRDVLDSLAEPVSPLDTRRRLIILGRARNVLGYALRFQGKFEQASQEYRFSLPPWRALKREVDQAEVLNNMAWALAEAGHFGQARRFCTDALEMRRALGYRYLVALSLNTMGLIEIRDDNPNRGLLYCEKALAMFEVLGTPRGVGLACTALAEANRRSIEVSEVFLAWEKAERLKKARKYALRAAATFREIPERLRSAEAMLELGCVYRDWARLHDEYAGPSDPSRETLERKGIWALQRAARTAGDEFFYRRLDAQVNLAWLYSYVERPELAREEVRKAEELVPPVYKITEETGLPKVPDPISFYWALLGKARTLQGWLAVCKYDELGSSEETRGQVRDRALIDEVVEHYTLALAYDDLFAEDFRDMRRAKNAMYKALRKINPEELKAMHDSIDRVAHKYHLDEQSSRPGQPPRVLMRVFLENYFGPPDQYEGLMV